MIPPPREKTGLVTFSPNSLRKYGAGGLTLEGMEEPRGCPRQWHHRYILKTVPEQTNEILAYGRVLHKVFELMEAEPIGPDEALMRCWDPSLPLDMYDEALTDLENYFNRPVSSADRYGTLATELEMTALLYVDEEYGPIYMMGIADEISVDLDGRGIVLIKDYKTNRHPPTLADLRVDMQGKTYSWLFKQLAEKLVPMMPDPKVLFQLDAIKWREMEPVEYSDDDLATWHAWTVAIVRIILRDQKHEPVINEGCAWCPVKDTCPAYQSLPDLASELLKVKPPEVQPPMRPSRVPWTEEVYAELINHYQDVELAEYHLAVAAHRERLAAWVKRVNDMRLLLVKAHDEANDRFAADAKQVGPMKAGPFKWEETTAWLPTQDLRRLRSLLTDEQFYSVVKTTKGALQDLVKTWPPADAKAVMDCLGSVPNGTTVKRTKV
jgi:RecB family exonuclease